MFSAHRALLQAELAVIGREIGIIIGLAAAAIAVAILVGILLYVGTFLFLGDWLFGSMGWGIIHGTLVGGVVIAYVGINLGGGDVSRYGWGFIIGAVVTVLFALLLLSNIGNEAGEAARRAMVEQFETERLPFGDEWLVLLTGIVVGGLIGAVIGLIIGWRSGGNVAGFTVGFAVLGAFVGAILLPTRYEAADGVMGLAITIGLITWIVTGVLLAARKGFDPEGRYADLVPTESIEAAKRTKEFVQQQWKRQKGKVLGR